MPKPLTSQEVVLATQNRFAEQRMPEDVIRFNGLKFNMLPELC